MPQVLCYLDRVSNDTCNCSRLFNFKITRDQVGIFFSTKEWKGTANKIQYR